MIDQGVMKSGVLPVAIGLAVALGAACAMAEEPAPAPSGALRYHFQKGDKHAILVVSVDSTKIQRIAEGTATSHVTETERGETWEVVGVSPRGEAEIEAWSKGSQVAKTIDGHLYPAVDVLQTKPGDPASLLSQVLSRYPRRLTITDRGEVTRVTGLEAAIDTYRSEVEKRTDDRQVRAMLDMAVEGFYGEENVRKLIVDILVPYPAQPVRKGDRWEHSFDCSSEVGRMAVRRQFKLDNDFSTDQPRQISATGAVTFTSAMKNVDVELTRARTSLKASHDPRTGFPQRRVECLDLDMTGYARGDGERKPVIRVTHHSRTRFFVLRWAVVVHWGNSQLLAQKGQLAQAIEELDKAIAGQPDCAVLYHNRGVLRQRSDDDQGAIRDFDKALQIDPDCDDSYRARGFSRSQTGDPDGAVKDYTEHIQRSPETWRSYSLRGWVHLDRKRYDLAIADFTKAIERNVDNPILYHTRATAHLRAGDSAAAAADMARFKKLRVAGK